MKIAATTASFGPALTARERTQLEWLDACANELEADGVVFELARFPRTDAEYLAQLKKTCVDLGLTVAALDADAAFWREGEHAAFDVALSLGAPLVTARAPAASARADAWNAFVAAAKLRVREAKACNVTIGLADSEGTLCPDGAALQRLAKDVDSAWLRYAPSSFALARDEHLLDESAIVLHAIEDVDRFARDGDREAATLLESLARFRGFLALSLSCEPSGDDAYHRATARFIHARSIALRG